MNEPIYKLRVPDNVAELIRSLHPRIEKKIKAGVREILPDPSAGKALRYELAGLMSFRISRFRIIYRLPNKKVVEIIAVGPRKNIYAETYRLVKKEEKEE